MLQVVPYDLDAVEKLSGKLRKADLDELRALGTNEGVALKLICIDALSKGVTGNAWAVQRDDGSYAGCFGYHRTGWSCFSLWTELSKPEARQVLRETKDYVLRMLAEACVPNLGNLVSTKNRKALRWLTASGCFTINTANPVKLYSGEAYVFWTKRVEDLP